MKKCGSGLVQLVCGVFAPFSKVYRGDFAYHVLADPTVNASVNYYCLNRTRQLFGEEMVAFGID